MSNSRFSLRWLFAFAGMTAVLAANADDDLGERGTAANQEAERRSVVSRVAVAKVCRMKVVVGKDHPVAAVLRPESLLRWSNPTVGSIYGEVFLWTIGDRPVAIASIYHRFDRPSGWDLELVSTTELPLRATDGPKTLWETGPGMEYRPLNDAPPPSPKAAARFSQMRKLAARFSAELTDQRNDEEVNRHLRLLPQPTHRYAAESEKVLDGALFAFVEATDPEIWIVLEAVQKANGTSWQYALARMDSGAMQVRLDGQVIQTWDKIDKPWANQKAPYALCPFSPDVLETEGKIEADF